MIVILATPDTPGRTSITSTASDSGDVYLTTQHSISTRDRGRHKLNGRHGIGG